MSSRDYTLGQALLTIENINVSYDHPVLVNVNANIKDIKCTHIDPSTGKPFVKGQVVALLGPSGYGKTQLFRTIAGLNKPNSGIVYINNCNCGREGCTKERCAVHAGDVGVVAQSYPLFPHRTVMGNLMLAAKRNGKTTAQAHDEIMAYLTEFELADKVNDYPASLSGGQRQRIAIIQQVLCNNHFILMDEPFSGLDPIALEKAAQLIQKIANLDELNTIIIVTHDVTAGCAVADTVWMLGHDKNPDGTNIPGTHIVKSYNLIDLDLAWHPDITLTPNFMAFVAQLKREFREL